MAEEKPRTIKGSVLEEEKEDEIQTPDYSDKERVYISNIQKRLENAKNLRAQQFSEFDGLTLAQYYQANEDAANTILKPKKNRGDIIYQSGTLRTKMMAFLASFQGLNLKPEISAFTKDDIPVNTLGNAMEDIVDKTEEVENDEEKKMLRQYELLKQGTVFLEETWEQKWEIEKKIKKGFYGQFNGVKWDTKKVKSQGQPKRTILSLLSVFLGDLREYILENQPYIFTVTIEPRSKVEAIYESWDRWKYVTKKKREFSGTAGAEMANNAWRFSENTTENQVEVIKYQDKPNQEFQIILNGVPMLPMGYPFPWGHGDYSVVQQNLEPIRHNFAYGKSFVFKNKNLIGLLDEMMKMGVLKFQKSVFPPYLNNSSRIITKSVFMPGNISRGIEPNSLVPVSEHEVKGVTAGEFNMMQEVKRTIDTNTASQTFTGAKEEGGKTTATQIIELQRQARIMMGIIILAASLLEKKLTIKRLMLLLQNWFEPTDTAIDEARRLIRNRYRTISRARSIEGEGQGIRITTLTENLPTPQQLIEEEDRMERETGKPVRFLVLNPKQIKKMRLTWLVNVIPKEKKTSEISKLRFENMITSAMNLGLQMDPALMAQRFAEVHEESPKLFIGQQPQTQAPPLTEKAPQPKISIKEGMPTGQTVLR